MAYKSRLVLMYQPYRPDMADKAQRENTLFTIPKALKLLAIQTCTATFEDELLKTNGL
jgi:hypothetical protein